MKYAPCVILSETSTITFDDLHIENKIGLDSSILSYVATFTSGVELSF